MRPAHVRQGDRGGGEGIVGLDLTSVLGTTRGGVWDGGSSAVGVSIVVPAWVSSDQGTLVSSSPGQVKHSGQGRRGQVLRYMEVICPRRLLHNNGTDTRSP